ncbi:unnamed protein product [Cuscuta campestris]|uniref:Uncharacterized protein n=2 Tax=Cuscuta sect. Cleistogrammica TaxID=1824901 RepID=A0A484NGK7_9ASTE|nr:hypothetical protein DM860_012112 [Cuscuta australis]VFR00433.1 unnamed protein product [Cuscuta campestris]
MEVSREISLFRSQIQNRRFDDATLRILESILVSGDAKSLDQIASALKDFMRRESLCILHETSALRSVDDHLLIVEFLVRVFALIADDESCLALRYEALLLRERKAPTDQNLRVSCIEWLTFAEHSFQNGFCSIARMACEKALSCFDAGSNTVDGQTGDFSKNVHLIEKIKNLKDAASITASSHSVQAQAAKYLKKKPVARNTYQPFPVIEANKGYGSVLFREGIKRRHLRKLQVARSRLPPSQMD